MFDAQLLITKTAAYSVFSPWFARLADNVRFTADLVGISGTPELKIEVVDRTAEGTGSGGSPLSGNITLTSSTSPPRVTTEWTGLKEFVRFKITLTPNASTAGDWVLFRILEPVWFSDVKV